MLNSLYLKMGNATVLPIQSIYFETSTDQNIRHQILTSLAYTTTTELKKRNFSRAKPGIYPLKLSRKVSVNNTDYILSDPTGTVIMAVHDVVRSTIGSSTIDTVWNGGNPIEQTPGTFTIHVRIKSHAEAQNRFILKSRAVQTA